MKILPRATALAFIGCFWAVLSEAAPDFYGVKMKSEDFARTIGLQSNLSAPDFSKDRAGLDKSVYAYAYTNTFLGRGRGLRIQVFNQSDKSIETDRLFRECVVLTRQGQRFDRSEPDMEWGRSRLASGDRATFNVTFPGADIRSDNIQMIIFSFGMGETSLYLFPLSPSSSPPEMTRAPTPPETKAPEPPKKKMVAAKTLPPNIAPINNMKVYEQNKETQNKKAPPDKKEAVAAPVKKDAHLFPKQYAPVKFMQSFFRPWGGQPKQTAAEPVATEPRVKKSPAAEPRAAEPRATEPRAAKPPVRKLTQLIEGVHYNFAPEHSERKKPWSPNHSDVKRVGPEVLEHEKKGVPRSTAEVLIVNEPYGFIVFDAGSADGVLVNRVVSVYRQGRRVGKLTVSKVRDRISAAVILPEWQTGDAPVQVRDIVGLE